MVRLDRLARSVSHLLAVIEQLEAAGAHFRSLRDPIDTTTPQGMFSLQVLGAVAQIERALSPAAIPVCAPATRTLGFMQLMLDVVDQLAIIPGPQGEFHGGELSESTGF